MTGWGRTGGALDEARRLLTSGLVGLAGADTADAGMGLLGELAGRGALGAVIEELLKDAADHPRDTLARALLSYRHPLGFRKVALIVEEPLYTLRAHVWPSDAAGTAQPEHIHNHRFALASYVVHGGMTMRLYAADAPGSPGRVMARYREEPGTAGAEGWRLARSGVAAVRGTAELRLAVGSEYWLAPDVLHQVLPRAEPTVTLFLETAGVRARTEVYAATGSPVPAWIPRRPLGVEDYLTALEELRVYPGCR